MTSGDEPEQPKATSEEIQVARFIKEVDTVQKYLADKRGITISMQSHPSFNATFGERLQLSAVLVSPV